MSLIQEILAIIDGENLPRLVEQLIADEEGERTFTVDEKTIEVPAPVFKSMGYFAVGLLFLACASIVTALISGGAKLLDSGGAGAVDRVAKHLKEKRSR